MNNFTLQAYSNLESFLTSSTLLTAFFLQTICWVDENDWQLLMQNFIKLTKKLFIIRTYEASEHFKPPLSKYFPEGLCKARVTHESGNDYILLFFIIEGTTLKQLISPKEWEAQGSEQSIFCYYYRSDMSYCFHVSLMFKVQYEQKIRKHLFKDKWILMWLLHWVFSCKQQKLIVWCEL